MSENPKTDSVNNLPVSNNNSTIDPDVLAEFDIANLNNQLRRHKTIGSLFDKAADVIGDYLDDPSTDLAAKMFPAKLATDIYLAQEKFSREDERIKIEKRKLTLEEIKVSKSPLAGSKFIQNNNYYQSQNNTNAPKVDIGDLKRKQEELLSSYLPEDNSSD